jgi:hypothetical protein
MAHYFSEASDKYRGPPGNELDAEDENDKR